MRVWLGVVGAMGVVLWACSGEAVAPNEPDTDSTIAATEVGDASVLGTPHCTILEGECGAGQAHYACEVSATGSHPIENGADGGVLGSCSTLRSTDGSAHYCCPSACIEFDSHWREMLPYEYDAADINPFCTPARPRMVLCPALANGSSVIPPGCDKANNRPGSPYAALCCKQ